MVDVPVADGVQLDDGINPYWDVFRWTELGVSSLANALGYPGGVPVIVKDEPGAAGIFVAYQTGTKGAGGLVYQQSDDRGGTWLGEVVIDVDIDKLAAAVIDPISYDIHLIYFQIGEPTLSTASNLWYRVLAWSGGVWVIGAEKQIILASASHGYSNASLEVRSGYLMAMLYDKTSTTVRNLYSAKAAGTWDLFTNVNLDVEQVMIPSTAVHVDLTRDNVGDKWYITTEQGGTFTIWSPSETLRPPGEITPVNLASWYGATTEQFDTVYNPSTAMVGIVQENGGALQFRTFDPATSLVSAPTVIEASGAFWPCITVDQGGRFVVAYTKTASGDGRHLMVVRSDDWTATHALATDSGVEGWGGTHIARISTGVDGLVIAWCETIDGDADGEYKVFCGVLDQQVFKAVAESVDALEFITSVHGLADAAAFVELLHASEPKSATDAAALVEALATWQNVAEAAAIAEAFLVNYRVTEGISFTDIFRLKMPVSDTGTATDIFSFVWKIVVSDVIAATDAVARLKVAMADAMSADDQLAPFGLSVAEAIAVGDAEVIWVEVAETAAAGDMPVICHTILDGASVDEIIDMTYGIIESAVASEGVWMNGGVIESVTATDAVLRMEVHSDSTIQAADSWAKLIVIRIGVRLHLHSGQARLRMER
jgi:hypothetical protein